MMMVFENRVSRIHRRKMTRRERLVKAGCFLLVLLFSGLVLDVKRTAAERERIIKERSELAIFF